MDGIKTDRMAGDPYRPFRVSVQRKILLLLGENHRYLDDFEVPEVLSQKGIGHELGLRQNHVSRALTELMDEGLVTSRSAHIKNVGRRRKVYFLTAKGQDDQEHYLSTVRKRRIPTRLPDGRLKSMTVQKILSGGKDGSRDIYSLLIRQYDGSEMDLRKGREIVSDQGPPVSEIFYGRKEELERIRRVIDDRERSFVSLISLAGMGKTSLLGKIVTSLPDHSVEWTTMTEWTGPERLLTRWSKFLASFGRTGLFDHLGSSSKFDIGSSVDIFLDELKGLKVLFIIDDYHRTGGSVDDLLTCIIGSTKRKDCTFLIGSRERPSFYGMNDVLVGRRVEEIILEGLDRESAAKLLRSRGIPKRDHGRIMELCKGHPLALLITAQSYQRDPSGWGSEIENYLGKELISTLDENERDVLYLAAAYEDRVVHDGLLILGGIDRSLLESLKEKMLLRSYPDGTMDVHDLLKENIRKWMGKRKLEEYTDIALDHLSGRGSERDILHYIALLDRSGRKDEMNRLILDLGSSILEWGDPMIRERISLMDPGDLSDDYRTGYLILKADMEISSGRMKGAERYLDRAQKECSRRIGSGGEVVDQLSRIHTLKAEISRNRGRTKEMIKVHLDNVRRMKKEGSRKALGKALNNLGQAYKGSGDLKRARKYLLEASRIFDEEDDHISRAFVNANLAEISVMMGERKDAKEYLMEVKDTRVRSARIEAKLKRKTGKAWMIIDQPDRARKDLERAYECSMDCGDRSMAMQIVLDIAAASIKDGRNDEGIKVLKSSIHHLEGDHPKEFYWTFLEVAGSLKGNIRELDEGLDLCIDHLIEEEDPKSLTLGFRRIRDSDVEEKSMIRLLDRTVMKLKGSGDPNSFVIISIWLAEMLLEKGDKRAKGILKDARKGARRSGFSKGSRRVEDLLKGF